MMRRKPDDSLKNRNFQKSQGITISTVESILCD